MPRKRTTLADLADRRRAMAARVAADGGRGAVTRVARAFGVTARTVQNACHEHDVAPPGNDLAGSTLAVIASLQTGATQADVAREHGLTPQRVSQIRQKALAASITFPDTDA